MPRKTDDTLLNLNKRWDVTDIALLEFAKYKDLDYATIAKLLDRSTGSVSQMGGKIRSFKRGKHDPSDPTTLKIEKALRLEFRVRSGELNDQRQYWLDRIGRETGTVYVVQPPQTPIEQEIAREESVDKPTENTATTDEENIELLRVSVSVNAGNIKKILNVVARLILENK
jgi:hypothetical protein